jgi:hypothetical protein
MEFEERMKALEDEFSRTRTETKQLMLDIRAILMEAWSPLRTQTPAAKNPSKNGGDKG